MVSKHIICAPQYDDYRKLANYICGFTANHKDKVMDKWIAGCEADGEDYPLAIAEIVATQKMNTATSLEKSYHLMISFRPEDNSRLTPQVLRDIEARFAASLGYEGHQRICAVHQNTDNLHLHVAYNLIHAQSYNRIKKLYDYRIQAKLRRELENAYGLKADIKSKDSGITEKAATVEALSGLSSFASYCQDKRQEIMRTMDNINNWQDLHRSLAQYGIIIKTRGNGLVLQANGKPKINMKASDFDRSFSKSKLEARLGIFETANEQYAARQNYEARPLNNAPLFDEYKQAKDKRRAEIQQTQALIRDKLAQKRQLWEQERQKINFMPLTKKDRYVLLKLTYQKEKQERQAIFNDMRKQTISIKEAYPYNSWPQFKRANKERFQHAAQKVVQERQSIKSDKSLESQKQNSGLAL